MALRILSDKDFDRLVKLLGETKGGVIVVKKSTLECLGYTEGIYSLLEDRAEEHGFGDPDLMVNLVTTPDNDFFPRERCCVCSDRVIATMKCRRDHLEGHHPGAANLTAREVLQQFKEE